MDSIVTSSCIADKKSSMLFSSWKDKHNIFRTHEKLKLKSVPTLLKWGTVSYVYSIL